MGRTATVLGVPPEAIWRVLSDPARYAEWGVGVQAIRDWDEDWPAPGARLQHRTGVPGLTLSDHTEVVEAEPPRRLVLRSNVRPLGAAVVELMIAPHPAGSRVTMVEDPAVPFPALLVPIPVHLLIRLRNRE